MTDLSNQQQNQSFVGILQVPGGVTSTLKQVQDGDGNNTGLWLSSTNTNIMPYDAEEQVITATAGQTVFNLSISYTPATDSLQVFVNGLNKIVGVDYLETDTDTVTFLSGQSAGALVKFTTAAMVSNNAVDASNVAFVGVGGEHVNVQDLADPVGSDYIGFVQSGTGAVTRSVQDKAREKPSVMDYGASQNVDCSAACAAMYAATGQVHFPAGSWVLNSPVVCSNAATITGEGSSCTTIFINGTHAFTLGDSTLATQTIKPFLVADLTFSSPGFTRGVSVDGLRMYNACWFSIQRCTFHTLNGAAIYARGGNWDGDVSNNHFQSCGATTGLAAIDVRYSGSLVNNHWKIHDNQFEGTYWSDIYVDGGNLGEDDHKIYANKFGSFEGHNTWTGALDVNQFHVQLYQSTGVTVLDNWFFQGGMVLVKYSYSKIIANHGRELSNGIYIDGSSQQDIDIGANYIAGNNSSDSVTGSLAANHFGVYSWCSNSQFYNNDIVKFNIGIYDRSGSASNSFYLNTGQDSSFNPSLNGSDAKLAGFYQSSTFTPVLSGDSVAGTQSYSGDTAGQYVIFGNLIFFSCVLTVTAFDAACAGNLYIGGLPYEPYIPAGNNLPQFTVQRTNINIGTSTQIQGQLASGSPARLYLLKYTAAGAEGTITKTDCTTNTGIRVSGVYRWKA